MRGFFCWSTRTAILSLQLTSKACNSLHNKGLIKINLKKTFHFTSINTNKYYTFTTLITTLIFKLHDQPKAYFFS